MCFCRYRDDCHTCRENSDFCKGRSYITIGPSTGKAKESICRRSRKILLILRVSNRKCIQLSRRIKNKSIFFFFNCIRSLMKIYIYIFSYNCIYRKFQNKLKTKGDKINLKPLLYVGGPYYDI